jgi:hypothetical protein
LIHWPDKNKNNNKTRCGIPYDYSLTVIVRCFVVCIWFRFDSSRALHEYIAMEIPYNKKGNEGMWIVKNT